MYRLLYARASLRTRPTTLACPVTANVARRSQQATSMSRSRFLSNQNHAQFQKRPAPLGEVTNTKAQLEAVSGELPSTPVGVPIGLNTPGGGGGGSGPNGVRDAVLTTVVGVIIEQAFSAGYDPALELAKNAIKKPADTSQASPSQELEWDLEGPWTQHLRREEQDLIDRIIQGKEVGHYFILLGPKAEGVAMCDAHPDLEVFRLRLGKALNYEYNEDTQTGLFQRRDPREGGGPALDIERALNKLEKVALKHAKQTGKPLILVLNNVHYFNHDDDGRNMLLQFQQRAEAWAASGKNLDDGLQLVGISQCTKRAAAAANPVVSRDDFWPFFVMRKNASRMHVVSVYDLSTKDSLMAAMRMRMNARQSKESLDVLKEVVKIVGGRLTYLGKATKAPDMVAYARHMLAVEKAWLLSQIGLIPDCDDDVMDEQKWSSCSWLLLREFVRKHQQEMQRRQEAVVRGEATAEELDTISLPRISYYECRQIMTRPDFMDELDRKNIIAIDINHDVTPDSWLILHAAEEVVGEDGFDDLLDSVRDRVDEIESLHRTRELTFKDVDAGDRIRLTVDKGGARMV
ncbi:hypothetical protein BN946_scf184608.g5 [Trametes cinnabarina]|uniref:AAA protein C-terminal winged helix domain-containing protein n=1 Tax=Pycnoporus cinnabarinus TaxID=5643 RepID=A0A060SV21_PYCCI|nr:hypothetical protein BN946_scf184608.g5 [Trametes cinnabarina]